MSNIYGQKENKNNVRKNVEQHRYKNNVFSSHVLNLIHLSDAYVHLLLFKVYTQNWKTIENNNFRIERLPFERNEGWNEHESYNCHHYAM